jgi:VanZ family protein
MILKNIRMRYRLIAWACLILVSFLFLLPGSALPKKDWFSYIFLDKWIHVILFAILTLLWLKAFSISKRVFNTIIFLMILYGILIELSQELFVRNRSMDFYDILADAAGVLLAVWLWRRYIKK